METIVKVSSRSGRNSNIEILRFLLLCSIFIWHLIVHGLDFKNVGIKPYPYNIHLTILATAFLSPAVNCFMFISGWFGMKLRWKKVCTLSIVCILTSCFCTFINRVGILNISGGQEGTWVYLFPVSNQLWWFMTAYMMVYLVSPFIEAGLQALDKKTMLISFVGMTAIEILSLPSGVNWGSTFFGLLYIYVIARYMRILNIELNARKGIAIYILALLSMILLEEFINGTMHKKERLFFMLDYNNPLIITQAVCIFYI